MTTKWVRASTLLLAILTIVVSSCTDAHSSDPAPSAAPPAQPDARPSCEVALPASWRQAFADGIVDTGGSTVPLAVGPAGEVAAVRDNGDTRDLLLIGADKSVTEIYPVPDPRSDDVGFVALDDRWIVVGVDRAPRQPHGGRPYRDENGIITAHNAPPPRLIRIDVIDRKDNSVRTVVENPEAEGKTLDSIALSADTVLWITRNGYSGDEGILRSYDLRTGAVAEVVSGVIRDLRVTAVGTDWLTKERFPTRLVRTLASLPAALAAVPGIEKDQSTLATDGTGYAWITDIAQGGNGFARWSPDTGLTRIKTVNMFGGKWGRPVHVDGPYVMLDKAVHGSGRATIVDTRSGAIALLDTELVDAGGGTIALQAAGPVDPVGDRPDITVLIRTDALPPLSC